ncbi:HlyD family efflux transporter periplasmic adaptor subunit [Belnapia rosea]|uniref:HlyD family secretion protein n=1 Tax=Belnapia rosea TaxID=938405 RepID=A0A1G7EA64_9PROT|nr:HlyD family secretion protein [Belnapia rosea]SDE60480.1 HlyD family secretion protein [Belnapia rosea]
MGLTAVAVAGYFIYDRFFALGSTNAVLSATPVVVRAPIDGQLTLDLIAPGTLLDAKAPIGKLANTRLDNSRVNELTAQVSAAEQEVDLIRRRITNAEHEAVEALSQATIFQKARVEQIGSRLDESEARIRNAQARLREAEGIQGRNEQLLRSGVATVAAVEQARRGLEVARGELDVAIRQRQGIRTELDAASQGIFTGETGTNRSASQQQYDRLRQQQRELSALFLDRQARLDALREQLMQERLQIARRVSADLEVLVRSRLIRVHAQSGEFVRQGQEIATLIDCTRPLVVAEVSDRIFRSLSMGMQGSFTPVGGGQTYQGTIVELQTPLTSQPGQSGSYRAIMQINDPALVQSCDTGRTGRVSF